MLLSFQRVDHVSKYLIKKGIDPDRISISAKGETEPKARNWNEDGSDSPLGRYLNRTVFVKIEGVEAIQAGLYGLYVPKSLQPDPELLNYDGDRTFSFTIQIMADLKPVRMSDFQGIDQIKEHICNDRYYRYTYGDYMSAQEASAALRRLQDSGYPDAYVRTCEWFFQATK
jgi:hypothetical protein